MFPKKKVEPVSLDAGFLPPASNVKPRGRPKGSKNKPILPVSPDSLTVVRPVTPVRPKRTPTEKALVTMQHVVEDTVALTAPMFDGGGTEDNSPTITKESLERRVARRLNVLDRYLTDERLVQLLQVSGLKEVGIYEGIMMDKALVLKGQPTVIVGSEDRNNMDTVLPKLLNELRRRKLITSVSERKIEFQEA